MPADPLLVCHLTDFPLPDDSFSVRVSIEPSGALRLGSYDVGPTVEQLTGDDDREHWVEIPARAVPKLVAALIRAHMQNGTRTVGIFKEFCQMHQIEHKEDIWS